MAHAKLGPSQAARWIACPGSVRMEAQLETQEADNPYSLLGTAAHQVAAECLVKNEHPSRYLGQPIIVHGIDGPVDIEMTQEDVNAVAQYIDYVFNRQDLLQGDLLIEHRVNPGHLLGREDLWGTADCLILGRKGIEVVDYKHGSGHAVPILDNHQLRLYGLGLIGLQPRMADTPVRLTIVQPRAPHVEGPIRYTEHTIQQLESWILDYTLAAAATDDPRAPLVPGEEQCRWCRAKSVCPALNTSVEEIFSPVGQPGGDSLEAIASQPVESMTLEHMLQVMDAEDLIKGWLKAIREHLTEKAQAGDYLPGYKLVETTTHRKWAETEEAMIDFLARLRTPDGKSLGKATVTKTTALSPAQAEKLIKPAISEKAWVKVKKRIISPPGRPTLVPESDSREAIKTGEEVFLKAAPWD